MAGCASETKSTSNELLLLDPFTGKPFLGSKAAKLSNKNAKDFLNILLLFTDYQSVAKSESDRTEIVKTLYTTLPFGRLEYRSKVKIFTPSYNVNLETKYPKNVGELMMYFGSSLTRIVKDTKYYDYIQPGKDNVWNLHSDPKYSRSEGFVCVISGIAMNGLSSDTRAGKFFEPQRPVPNWARAQSATKENISYIALFANAPIFGVGVSVGKNFIHELGHSFGLQDEYEQRDISPPSGNPAITNAPYSSNVSTGVRAGLLEGKHQFANIVSKESILNSTSSVVPWAVPTSNEIDSSKIPWERMMQASSNPGVIPHKARTSISDTACVNSGHHYLKLNPNGVGLCVRSSTTTDIPSGRTGLYEGGYEHSFDVYRPDVGCQMRFVKDTQGNEKYIENKFVRSRFCPVCVERMKFQIADPDFENTLPGFKKWIKRRYP